MEIQIIFSVITTLIGTLITVSSFYRALRKDKDALMERRVQDAAERAKQHAETAYKLDTIIANHAKMEKDLIKLELRVGAVENRLTKNEAEHAAAESRFTRLEEIIG